jgi:hypothetical protein
MNGHDQAMPLTGMSNADLGLGHYSSLPSFLKPARYGFAKQLPIAGRSDKSYSASTWTCPDMQVGQEAGLRC